LFAAMSAICVVVIVVVGANLSVPNKSDFQYKRMFAVSIAVDNFLKHIGHTKNVSDPATAYLGKTNCSWPLSGISLTKHWTSRVLKIGFRFSQLSALWAVTDYFQV